MTFDRKRVMQTAHAEWRGTQHKPGVTFGKCLALAWAVEKKRAAGPQHYQPLPAPPPRGARDIIDLRTPGHKAAWKLAM